MAAIEVSRGDVTKISSIRIFNRGDSMKIMGGGLFLATLVASGMVGIGCQVKKEDVSGAVGDGRPPLADKPEKYRCEAGVQGPGIIGGEKLSNSSRLSKSIVRVQNFDATGKGASCTGSIIGSDIILTAAHCFPFAGQTNTVVRVEFSTDPVCDRDKNQLVWGEASHVAIHPGYVNSEGNDNDPLTGSHYDIALVKLKRVVPDDYQTIALPKSLPPLTKGEVIHIAGYGKTTDYDIPDTGFVLLRLGEVVPSAPFLGVTNDERSEFLAMDQSNGKSICAGDSGGPAIRSTPTGLEVIGVAQSVFGEFRNSPKCYHKAIYNNVYFHREWIHGTYLALMGPESSPSPYEGVVELKSNDLQDLKNPGEQNELAPKN
jgi:Trypsin